MGMIFEDISIEETQDFMNYESTEGYQDDLKGLQHLDIENSITKGFLLSYGQNAGIIPVGTFVLAGYEDKEGTIVDELDAILNEGYVVFKQIEVLDNHVVFKPNGGTVSMPYKTYTYMLNVVAHNNREFGLLSKDQGITPDAVEDISQAYAEELLERNGGSDVKQLDLYGSRLEEAHALYTSADNKEMGSNYTMYPFELVLGMYMDSDLLKEDFDYKDSNGTITR